MKVEVRRKRTVTLTHEGEVMAVLELETDEGGMLKVDIYHEGIVEVKEHVPAM